MLKHKGSHFNVLVLSRPFEGWGTGPVVDRRETEEPRGEREVPSHFLFFPLKTNQQYEITRGKL